MNKGLSLIELVVAVAIVAVLASAAFLSAGSISGAKISKVANYLDTAMSESKTYILSAESGVMKISKKNDSYILIKAGETDEEKIAGNNIEIVYFKSDSINTPITIDKNNELVIGYDRSSGAFKPISGIDVYCEKIVIKNGDKEVEIDLVPVTGKHFIVE